jgi:glucose/arabinose dehydrogenase
MRGKYNQGTAFWFRIVFDNEGYLYFSAGERGAEFVNPQDITRDNGKTASMRMEEFLQTILCRKTGAKAIYSYGHRNPQG